VNRSLEMLFAGAAFLVTACAAPRWTTSGDMGTPRKAHTATLLPNGKLLVVGGQTTDLDSLSSAELYDPHAGTRTATTDMAVAREGHTATLLLDGRVLVAGGFANRMFIASAELYDPNTGVWSPTGDMQAAIPFPRAIRLPGGEVLVVAARAKPGECLIPEAELYDPSTGNWSLTGAPQTAREGPTIMRTGRRQHTATLLADGQVLVVGGEGADNVSLATTELYAASPRS
jgi:hypothetical protein